MDDDDSTDKSKLISGAPPVKKPRKTYRFNENSGKVFDTNTSSWQIYIRLVSFVIFACFLSITIAAKLRFTPIVSHALSVHFKSKFPQAQIEWIGRLYPIVVLCLLPIASAVIDSKMIGYRFGLIISGLLHTIACITNSTVTHPLFFVLTDSFICGFGSAIAFSIFLLAIDDIFPKGNRFRVLATTMCQGSTIGSLFVVDLYAWMAKYFGWMMFQLFLACLFAFLAIGLIITCPEYGLSFQVRERGGPKDSDVSVYNEVHSKSFRNKWLGLTFEEMQKSPSLFPWLVYRFSMNIIHFGVFLLVLKDTHIITIPDIESLLVKYYASTVGGLTYASGEAMMYIMGAIVGIFLIGYLLHISVVMLCILFLALVIWQPIRSQHFSNSMVVGHCICAGITGMCLGGLNTCMIATSEEATMIPARRVYPFMKLLEGLAFTFSPFLFQILNRISSQNIWLLTFAVMTAANACLLVFILHRLYMKFIIDSKDRKVSIMVSMKPAKFLSKGFDSP